MYYSFKSHLLHFVPLFQPNTNTGKLLNSLYVGSSWPITSFAHVVMVSKNFMFLFSWQEHKRTYERMWLGFLKYKVMWNVALHKHALCLHIDDTNSHSLISFCCFSCRVTCTKRSWWSSMMPFCPTWANLRWWLTSWLPPMMSVGFFVFFQRLNVESSPIHRTAQ